MKSKKKIKKWLPTIIGFVFLEGPRIIAELYNGTESHIINTICSIVALIAFSLAICLDGEWHLKEEFKLRNKDNLEKMQGIITLIVFYGVTVIGYIFHIKALIPFYAQKDGHSFGFTTFLITLLVTGIFTLVYKLITKTLRVN